MMKLLSDLKTAFILLLLMSILTGLIYPGVMTLFAQMVFPWQANGSLLAKNGSALIGQHFTEDRYFWGRPSATPGFPYNAANSSGSNLGPLNPLLIEAVKMRIDSLKQADPDNHKLIPVDLVTSSASGLDPDISLDAAYYQVSRVAKARHIDPNEVIRIIKNVMQPRVFGFLGERKVNVLILNLALDAMNEKRTS